VVNRDMRRDTAPIVLYRPMVRENGHGALEPLLMT
jgi:hypothetical protein